MTADDKTPNTPDAAGVIPPSPSATDHEQDMRRDLDWVEARDPIALFEDWMRAAGEAEVNDPNAMSLATVDADGLPDVRIVLLKGLTAAGFDFYTNSLSAKGQQIEAHPKAALCFHWKSLRRQVRVRGTVTPVGNAASDAYFATRARGSRLSAWASEQSRPAADRDELLASMHAAENQFEGEDVPRPPHWFGYRVTPQIIEFWQDGAFRLHDRIVFNSTESGAWTKTRLYP